MPKQPCAEPGCRRLVEFGRCPGHARRSKDFDPAHGRHPWVPIALDFVRLMLERADDWEFDDRSRRLLARLHAHWERGDVDPAGEDLEDLLYRLHAISFHVGTEGARRATRNRVESAALAKHSNPLRVAAKKAFQSGATVPDLIREHKKRERSGLPRLSDATLYRVRDEVEGKPDGSQSIE